MKQSDFSTTTYGWHLESNGFITFCKTKDEYGFLSNMAAGFPIKINDIEIRTSEALYQACRFPDQPLIQRLIIDAKSPMTAKNISRAHTASTRSDWNEVRIDIMYACLLFKTMQNFSFASRIPRDESIIEISYKDTFWGAYPHAANKLTGMNVLGKLLQQIVLDFNEAILCEALMSKKGEEVIPWATQLENKIKALNIPDFLLYSKPII